MSRNKLILCFSAIILPISIIRICSAEMTDDSRIRRLVNDLSDKRSAQSARVNLVSMGPQAVPYLLEAARNKERQTSTRVLAINALIEIKDKSAEKGLIPLLKDDDVKIRRIASKALGILGTSESVKPLTEALCDYDAGVRFNATRSLDEIGDPSIVDVYVSLTRDSDPRIRLHSVTALGKAKDAKTVRELSELKTDPDANVRLELAKTLGEIADPSAIETLNYLAANDPDGNVRREAIKSVARIQDPRSVDILIANSNSADKEIRYLCVQGMMGQKAESSIDRLIEMLKDEAVVVKASAAKALASFDNAKAKDALKAAVDDESSAVRYTARIAVKEQ